MSDNDHAFQFLSSRWRDAIGAFRSSGNAEMPEDAIHRSRDGCNPGECAKLQEALVLVREMLPWVEGLQRGLVAGGSVNVGHDYALVTDWLPRARARLKEV